MRILIATMPNQLIKQMDEEIKIVPKSQDEKQGILETLQHCMLVFITCI